MRLKQTVLLSLVVVCAPAFAQEMKEQPPSPWAFGARIEIRANYRYSHDERFALKFPFPPDFLPVGQTVGFERTVDPGRHAELSVGQLKLDASYGHWFNAHVQFHAWDKYRRNPTSSDRTTDADELYVRFGRKPEFLDRPDGTSFFVQAGKAPKMERQPVRLLESYGVAATAFNRMEDTQVLAGGTIGRSLYWRLQLANGNPLFFRDPNALAGDNGTPALNPFTHPHPEPQYNSGFPILYNAEAESLFLETKHVQFGQGFGYRWSTDDGTSGLDAIAFHYRRSMADEAKLTGTFYGGDLDLLLGPVDAGLPPLRDRTKEEYGGRVYAEWRGATAIVQFTKQHVAGLQRQGYEVEAGYRFALNNGWMEWIQPAARVSGLTNRFRGDPKLYPAPSIWWPWTKIDLGARIGFPRNVDLTIEYAKNNVGAPKKLDLSEALATVRVRI